MPPPNPVRVSLLLHEKIQDERKSECTNTYFYSSGSLASLVSLSSLRQHSEILPNMNSQLKLLILLIIF